MKFVGVQLEFIQQRQSEVPGSLEQSLALFDIQDSEFSFQSRSNQRRTVDFTNHVVIGYDTRYNSERVAVFSKDCSNFTHDLISNLDDDASLLCMEQ